MSFDFFTLHSKTVSAILINSLRSLCGLIRPPESTSSDDSITKHYISLNTFFLFIVS